MFRKTILVLFFLSPIVGGASDSNESDNYLLKKFFPSLVNVFSGKQRAPASTTSIRDGQGKTEAGEGCCNHNIDVPLHQNTNPPTGQEIGDNEEADEGVQ